jgi:hypothetical protein
VTEPRDAVAEVCDRLAKYPHVKWSRSEFGVTIQPVDGEGFEIELEREGDGYYVRFWGWHEHPESAAEALEWVAFGLSNRCRLAVHYRWSTPVRWVVESSENGEWREANETGPLFLSLLSKFGPRRIVRKQNRVLDLLAAQPETPVTG